MAESCQSAFCVIIMTIIVLEFITSSSLNGYIFKVSIANLKGARSPTELIYLFMGLVNMLFQITMTLQNIVVNFFPNLFAMKSVYLVFNACLLGLVYYSFYLTAWLCVHFCISLTNFNHRVFIRLRRAIYSFLLQFIVMSAIGPVVLGIMSIWFLSIEFQEQSPGNLTSLYTAKVESYSLSPVYCLISILLGSCPPFIIASISTGATLVFLLRHTQKMKQKTPGSSGPNLKALTNATRTMILLLILSLVFCVSELLLCTVTNNSAARIIALICGLVIMSYSSAEAIIIIQASPKMKKGILGRLCVEKSNNKPSQKSSHLPPPHKKEPI